MPALSNSSQIPLIHGLSEIAHRYEGVILDLFGVLHDGLTPYPGTIDCLEKLKSNEKKIVLLSNTPKRSENSKDDLAKMEIHHNLYDSLITAGDAAHNAIQSAQDSFHAALGKKCYFMGGEIAAHLTDELDLECVEDISQASFILNAMPDKMGFEEAQLQDALVQGAEKDIPMVCANPDIIVHIGNDLHHCAGHYARLYEDMGGKVAYHGKPYGAVYEMARSALGINDKNKILAMGDSLQTDIQGAVNYGIPSIFNVIGIHREEIFCKNQDEIDMDQVMLVLKNTSHHPNMIMAGLKW